MLGCSYWTPLTAGATIKEQLIIGVKGAILDNLLDFRVENREVRSLFLGTPGNFSALVIEKVVQLEELDDLSSLICLRTVEEEGTTIVCLYI